MELRKDPITQTWVVLGHSEATHDAQAACPLCPQAVSTYRTVLQIPGEGPWQVRVIPHLHPLYRIEGEVARQADGIYDRMQPVGAHEIIVETPRHDERLSQLNDGDIEKVLWAYAARIVDLKRDSRFKYVAVYKNYGPLSGEEWSHAHSQVTATTFVPRRLHYELRASREWYVQKERCVYCDILRQEEKQGKRIVDVQGDYYAICPYASRVPYEIWLIHRKHNHLFELPKPGANRHNLAALLGRTLRRLGRFATAYHLVVHTSPNTQTRKGELAGYWKTLADDYHWHIEILPIVQERSKSYSIKEVYFNSVLPEEAAEYLRKLDPHT